MPALQEVVVFVKFGCLSLLLIASLSTTIAAQTSVNDVHVVSREVALPSSESPSSLQIAQNSRPAIIKADVRLVLVPVSVTDAMERFVTGLNQSNFQVFDNKREQKIQHFSREDVPVSLGIIVDVSGSMGDKVARLREAVTQFCEAANPEDEFFMITFSNEPQLAVDFTSSTVEVEKELVFTQPKGRTSLLDAIYMGLKKMSSAKYGKKALLIISDGGDNHSRYGEHDVKSLARESDVMIYSIGVFDRYVPTQEELRGPSLLSDIAEPTGGRAYTLDNANGMAPLARHIGMELRNQYVLAYRPQEAAHDGKWRKVRVKLMLPKRFSFLRAHAKTGYYASEE